MGGECEVAEMAEMAVARGVRTVACRCHTMGRVDSVECDASCTVGEKRSH